MARLCKLPCKNPNLYQKSSVLFLHNIVLKHQLEALVPTKDCMIVKDLPKNKYVRYSPHNNIYEIMSQAENGILFE